MNTQYRGGGSDSSSSGNSGSGSGSGSSSGSGSESDSEGGSDSGSSEEGSGSGSGSDSGSDSDSGSSESSPQEVLSSWKNSAEITKSGTTINTGNAQNLYTITIHYPSGQYSGANKGNFRISGSGTMKNSMMNANFLTERAAPSGESNWSVLIGGRGNETVGEYWFTDEVNKIKYYRTTEAINEAYSPKFPNRELDYWNPIKQRLLNGIFKNDVLGQERRKFNISGYNKSQTGYFNVIFDDLGSKTVSVGSGVSGVAGQYQPKHIRDENGSNSADIFYVNNRYFEACCKTGVSTPSGAADTIMTTLVHEYMHYLMDSNVLKNTENDELGTSYNPFDVDSFKTALINTQANNATALTGSLFWIEGTANHAPYSVIGSAGKSAVKSWLGDMNKWRPSLNAVDDQNNVGYDLGSEGTYVWQHPYGAPANAGNDYAVYGAGGLFMSYIAEKYGQETINRFHKWYESPLTLKNILESNLNMSKYNFDTTRAQLDFMYDSSWYTGDINRITKDVMGGNCEFKDVYLNFLMQCMSSISSDVCMKDCVENFVCSSDWGFTKDVLDNVIDTNGFDISNASSGYSASNLPELSFVINRWEQIPEKLTLSGDNMKCYAVWF